MIDNDYVSSSESDDSEDNINYHEPEWTDKNAVTQPFNLNRPLPPLDVEGAPYSKAIDFDYNAKVDKEALSAIREAKFWTYAKKTFPHQYKWGDELTHSDNISYQNEEITEPLTRICHSNHEKAFKIFRQGQKYSDKGTTSEKRDIAFSKYCDIVFNEKRRFHDEAFIQLIKQIRNNEDQDSYMGYWRLLAALSAACTPSDGLFYPLLNLLLDFIENHEVSAYKTWARYVFGKLWMCSKLLIQRKFQPTPNEGNQVAAQKKVLLNIYLCNGAYYQVYVESHHTYLNLKKKMFQLTGIDMKYYENFGFLEVVDRHLVYEERYLEPWASASEAPGFWIDYNKSKSDIRNCKIYFTFKVPLRLTTNTDITPWQFIQFCNDFKRGKHECSDLDVMKVAALMLQADLGDYVSNDDEHFRRRVLKYIPVNRKDCGLEYWQDNVIANYKKFKGQGREKCIKGVFEEAYDWLSYDETLFSGIFNSTSDQDRHDQSIPENVSVFMIGPTGLKIMDSISREIKVDLEFPEMTNWGCSNNTFVYSTGETHSLIKEYFYSPAAVQICYLMNINAAIYMGNQADYTSLYVLQPTLKSKKTKRCVSLFYKTCSH